MVLKTLEDNIERVKAFFKKNYIYQVLRICASSIGGKMKNLEFDLKIGGGSWTNGSTVRVGLPEMFLDVTDAQLLIALKALTGHEIQHTLSSDFKEFSIFVNDVGKYFFDKYGISTEIGQSVGKHIGNSIEDGRIEKILGSKLPGYIRYLQYLNGTIWDAQPVNGKNEFEDFLYAITSFCVTGLSPKDFEKVYNGTEVEKQLDAIKTDIIRGINANSCKDGLRISWKIIRKMEIFIVNYMKRNDEFLKFLKLIFSQFEWTTSGEKEYNSSDKTVTVHFKPEESDNGNENIDKNEASINLEGAESSDDNLVNRKMQEIEDDTVKKTESEIKEAEVKERREEKRNPKLNVADLDEIEARYQRQYIRKFKEIECYGIRQPLPLELKINGAHFRKEVERILRNKEGMILRCQNRGVLDSSNLYRVGLQEYNVFTQKGIPSKSEYVAFVLKDGSGSMKGSKDKLACSSCAILEEGLKGIIPLKISTFSTNDGCVSHYMAKDFDQMSPANLSWNSYVRRKAKGGNKDGYSIQVAAKELLKRPEQNKILIILSDGLPSNYDGGEEEGLVDVKKAVREARANGIHVVAIMFGGEVFRDSSIDAYKYMYEKNIISCDPNLISYNLVKIFKTIIKH